MTDDLKRYTLPQLLQRWAKGNQSDQVPMREKDLGVWQEIGWQTYYTRVRQVALGLNELGFAREEKLVIIGDNNPELLYMQLGVQSLGGVSVGVYQTSLLPDIEYAVNYVDATMVFADDQEQVDKLLELRDKLPKVTRVIYEDPRGMRGYQDDEWIMSIYDLMKIGEQVEQSHPERYETFLQQGKPDEVCHFCLTSGTTGRPKAAMLTHLNMINMAINLNQVDYLSEDDEYLSFLPTAWIGEQMISIGMALVIGLTINFAEETETAMEDLKEIGPHVVFGAPRFWENIRSQVWLKIDESSWFNQKIYHYFMGIGRDAASYRMRGKTMPFGLKIKAWIGESMIFKPLRNQLGLLRLRRAYTGGAALGPDLFNFYQGMGVNLKQIYGQTEIIGIAYTHRDGDIKPDTVGLPIPGNECKITEKGEILSKSDSVCAGYYKRPEDTDELLKDGWMHSGDAGYLDKDGHLVVIDRVSDVMYNKEGEMFSPMFLENKLKFSPFVKEAVIWGDQKDYISAFINVDPVTTGKWAEDQGISYTTYMDLSQKEEVAKFIYKEVESVNANIEKGSQRIQRFVLLFKLLDVDDGELTQTGKVRRQFIEERYREVVDALYDPQLTQKHIQTTFKYQDGQETSVETDVNVYTIGA